MRLRSSISETSFYPSEPHPIIVGPPAALILSVWHRSRPKPICCKLYGHGRCEARSCGLIFQSLRHGKSPYFFFERSLPRMTLENQRERAQGRLFCSLLLTDSGSFFFFFCVLIVSSCLCTCKYFISLPAFCLTPGDLMRRSQERTSLQDNGPAATYPLIPMQGHTGQLLPRFSRPRFTRKPFGWKIDRRDGTVESRNYFASHLSLDA